MTKEQNGGALLCYMPEPRTGCRWFAPSKDDREKCRHAGARPEGFDGYYCTSAAAVADALSEITGGKRENHD